MSPRGGSPPRWIERLLAVCLPRESRESILGDLSELYSARIQEGRPSPVVGVWYGWHAARVALAYTLGGRRRPRISSQEKAGATRTLGKDLGHAAAQVRRLIRHSPGFTGVVAATLAVGMGASIAAFSLVDAVLLEPLPFRDPDRLVSLWHSAPGMGIEDFWQSEGSYLIYREARTLDDVGLYSEEKVTLSLDASPSRIQAMRVTASFFTVLGVSPRLGRPLNEAETAVGGPNSVVISHDLWSIRFGRSTNVLGRSLHIDGESWTVVGVMPRWFSIPGMPAELWLPYRIDPADPQVASFSHRAVARLGVGYDQATADRELDRLLHTLPELYPDMVSHGMLEDAEWRAYSRSLRHDAVGNVRRPLWLILAAMTLVLLIACGNAANLILVRAHARGKEMAVRLAIGARTASVRAIVLAETLALAALGGAGGLCLAWIGMRALRLSNPIELPLIRNVGLDPTVVAYTALLVVVAGLALGEMAHRRHRSSSLICSLREGGRSGELGARRQRLRQALVVAQIAISLVMLVGSGLMYRTFRALNGVDPGFSREEVLTFRLALPSLRYPDRAAASRYFEEVADAIAAVPGVVDVGGVSTLPLQDIPSVVVTFVEGHVTPADEMPPTIRTRHAREGFFRSMGIPLLRGRAFERRDAEEWTGAAVVSRAFVDRYWPNGDPIGKGVAPYNDDGIPGDRELYRVVGVVDDVRDTSLTEEPEPLVYYSMAVPVSLPGGPEPWNLAITVRTQSRPEALLEPIRQAVWALDRDIPFVLPRTTAALVGEAMAVTSFVTYLLLGGAIVALLLGTVGMYGVVSYIVSHRTSEIGVRMALGADAGAVQQMVVRDGLLMGSLGVVIGVGSALFLTKLMGALLFGVSPLDGATYAVVTTVMLSTVALASWVPARRASRVPPTEALRHE